MDIFFPKNQPVDLKSLVKSSGISFDKLKQLVQDNELQVRMLPPITPPRTRTLGHQAHAPAGMCPC